jgi:hypothetical protein
MSEDDRSGLWPLYGWFSGLMCAAGVFGNISTGAFVSAMLTLYSLSRLPYDTLEAAEAAREFYNWLSAYYITYSVEFLCSGMAKLIVLDRLAGFGSRETGGTSHLFSRMRRYVFIAIIACNVLCICSNVLAAAFSLEGSKFNYQAAHLLNRSDSGPSLAYNSVILLANNSMHRAQLCSSIQEILEALMLLLIVMSFVAVGVSSVRRVEFSLRSDPNVGASGMRLRQQILVTVVFLFVTLLLRTVHSFIKALGDAAGFFNNFKTSVDVYPCGNDWCDSRCYTDLVQMSVWFYFTPEFTMIIFLLSSPLALLVALWGMTSERMLQRMRNAGAGQVSMPARFGTSLLKRPQGGAV